MHYVDFQMCASVISIIYPVREEMLEQTNDTIS